MADSNTINRATIEVREIDGKTKRVIVCSECRMVAAEYGQDTRIDELVLEATISRHIELRHSDEHVFETYVRSKNKMEPGIVLRDRRLH